MRQKRARGRLRRRGALVAAPAAAQAAIPASLKSSCVTRTPHPGLLVQFCDDGLPNAGGPVANPGGVAAVTVPAKYDGYSGLPAEGRGRRQRAGRRLERRHRARRRRLAADPGCAAGRISAARLHARLLRGQQGRAEATAFDAGGDLWHYSNAWFASRGYVVVNYTARGFVQRRNNGDRGSTGETQLDSRLYEINDFQSWPARSPTTPSSA